MKTLLTEAELRAGVASLGEQIRERYDGRPLTLIAVMTGSLVFLADLIRVLDLPVRVGVIQASSYSGGMKAGELTTATDMLIDVAGHDVLLVDDIFDTGKTLDRLMQIIQDLGAKSVGSAVLLHKQRQHDVSLRPDYVAFEIPDEFVVGYGLDYLDLFRNLPHLAVLDQNDIEAAKEQAES